MTETEARQYCIAMGRNPDREMAGTNGTFKAWEFYGDRLKVRKLNLYNVTEVAGLANELNTHPDETQD